MSNQKSAKDIVIEKGVTVGIELAVSFLRLIFAELRRKGMTPEEVKAALLAELMDFEANPPEDIPDV